MVEHKFSQVDFEAKNAARVDIAAESGKSTTIKQLDARVQKIECVVGITMLSDETKAGS